MGYYYGSIPVTFYGTTGPIAGNFLLITDGSFFLMTNHTPLKLAGG